MQATTVSRGNNTARRGLVSPLLATMVSNMIEVLYSLNKTDKSNITTLLKAFETPWVQVWIFCLCYKGTMKLSIVKRKCYLLNVLMGFAFSFQINYFSSGTLFSWNILERNENNLHIRVYCRQIYCTDYTVTRPLELNYLLFYNGCLGIYILDILV